MASSKRILVLGASGKSGLRTVERALKAGHTVIAYLRNDTTLSEETKRNPNLTVCLFSDEFVIFLACFSHLTKTSLVPDP
jgi:nucleoside-diphosphate-sugar epimerase